MQAEIKPITTYTAKGQPMPQPATIYNMTIPAMVRGLNNLSAILDKGIAFAEGKKVDTKVLAADRLIADMFPLSRQVQVACDFAKGAAARLSGVEVPKFEDTEATLPELKERIAKTLTFINSLPETGYAGADTRKITLKIAGQDTEMDGITYVTTVALPNFYFHFTTAYNLLRKNGVEIGKGDFTGRR
jgi:hypothetical protein